MKRASYEAAVSWIAFNDGWGDRESLSEEHVRGQVTVGLIADIFQISRGKVAADIVRVRTNAEEKTS